MQTLHLLMALGHRGELRRALDLRTREILAGHDDDWRRPRSNASA
jgi:hypothetical protein